MEAEWNKNSPPTCSLIAENLYNASSIPSNNSTTTIRIDLQTMKVNYKDDEDPKVKHREI